MVKVESCQFSPPSITLGMGTRLDVGLDAPAPAGGVTVVLSYVMNGAADTLVTQVQSIPITQGTSSGQTALQTEIVANASTQITVYASTAGTPAKSATLAIN